MSLVQQSDSRLFSTWTPLNNDQRNREVFGQRKELFLKWFEKWSSPQRKKIIDGVLSMSNESQLHYINAQVSSRISMKDEDFTRALPRIISLYILSYLDPRTLCRCARVSWYWKYLSELDQLWMLKCLRLGWNLSFTPSPYEHSLWKRNYVENYQSLQYLREQVLIESAIPTPRSARSHYNMNQGPRPAWRGSDPVPKDTMRFNYLNNTDQVETVKMLRNRSAMLKQSKHMKTKRKTHEMTTLPDNKMITAEKSVRVVNEGPAGLRNYNLSYGERPTWAKPQENRFEPVSTNTTADDSKLVNDLNNLELKGKGRNTDYLTTEKVNSHVQLPADGRLEAFTKKPWKIPEPADDDY